LRTSTQKACVMAKKKWNSLDLPSHPAAVNYQDVTTDIGTCLAREINRCPLEVLRTPPLYPSTMLSVVIDQGGVLTLPAGILALMLSKRTGSFRRAVFISVSIYPGATALTVTPRDVHSLAKLLVSWPTAPLDAA
jgi:hypothetical protein